jgi:multidrug efflux pump subunit AcrB
MSEMINLFRKDYPQMEFEISQDQTLLLDYSISNLKQDLWAGGIMAFLLMFFFLKDGKSPLIIGISIPTTLVISLLFFYLVGLSVNIISLAGLVLGVGMMIDNSIVVIENITQWIEKGLSLVNACVKGTNEVITPLISSVLTTCAVFIPLIFLSGISGALFYDQAMAIVIGQGVSLLVGITLLPTIYYLLYKNGKRGILTKLVEKVSIKGLESTYEGGMDFFFEYKKSVFACFIGTLLLMMWFFFTMEKEKFPAVKQDEMVISVDWNENIDTEESLNRIKQLLAANSDHIVQSNSFIGEQQFLFNRDYDQTYTQAKIYIKTNDYKLVNIIKKNSQDFITRNYPDAVIVAAPQQNVFEKIFSANETPLIAEVSLMKEKEVPPVEQMTSIIDKMRLKWPDAGIAMPPLEDKILLRMDPDKMLLYDVNPNTVYSTLKTSLNQNNIGELRASYEILPIILSDKEKQINEIISAEFVPSKANIAIPIREVVKAQRVHDYKSIKGGLHGEYVPVNMNITTNNPAKTIEEIREMLTKDPTVDVRFSGGLLTGQTLFRELTIVLLVALLLLYFILAAQFESLTQPLIVLLEIPIDIAGALLLVKLWGGTINIMTMIGLIVMSGVIINDSILKVDTINNLRREGTPLLESIYTAGSRRLKPIVMVALAALVSTFPIVLSSGIGSELQRPMGLAIIGGMSLGTIVSLFFIPLAYWYIYRKSEKETEAGKVNPSSPV